MAEGKRVFGVALNEIMSRPTEKTIPSLVKKIIRYLNANAITTEGLFRISVKGGALQDLKTKIDAGEDVDFGGYNDPHLVAGLLKTYLRELPEPLFTFALYPKFVQAATDCESAAAQQRVAKSTGGFDTADSSSIDKYIEALSQMVDELPSTNKALAEILLLFLSRVGDHSAQNKMPPASLAIVFGQILLRPKVETIESMINASKITGIMKFMIEHFDQIFPKTKKRVPAKGANATSSSGDSEGAPSEELQKLSKIKDTVDDAISVVQKKLLAMSSQLRETDSLEVAVEIARRVRTAKKVLFSEEARPAVDPSQYPPPERTPGQFPFEVNSGSVGASGKRKTMEDMHIVLDNMRTVFPQLSASDFWAFYAVYDGHGGAESSKLCAELLHRNIVRDEKFMSGNIPVAMRNGFLQTDSTILKESAKRGFKDGTTAVVVVVHNKQLLVANAGDSEAILCRRTDGEGYEAVVLTEKHRATDVREKARIEQAGGAVFSGRVFGALAVSRSLGDGDFKIPTSETNFVTSEPFITAVDLTPSDEFVLMACDGLWDKVSYAEAAELTGQRLVAGDNPNQACEALVEEARARGSMDDITVLLVCLKWN